MEFSVFVSSSDSYSDLWPIFFELFKRQWPEFDGKIYLQTQNKTFAYDGLNITCTNVGMLHGFGRTLLAGLEKVSEENILFFMIDYIFMGKVDNSKVLEYYEYFKRQNLDSLVLSHLGWINSRNTAHADFVSFIPPSKHRLFGYQIAFWKKNIFMSIILPYENPWLSEWFGDARCARMKIRIECLKKNLCKAIPYDSRGCLHQGHWLDNAVLYIQQQNLKIDYNERGLYSDFKTYNSFNWRLKHKIEKIKCGLLGSYLDIWLRHPIH